MSSAKKTTKKPATENCSDEMALLFLREIGPVLLDISRAGDRGDRSRLINRLVAVRILADETLTALVRDPAERQGVRS